MAELLNIGNGPFLSVKVAIGIITAAVLIRYSQSPVARHGLTISLAVYLGLMTVHIFTGLNAFGYLSDTFFSDLNSLPNEIFALMT